jgi:hypothetical protein
MEILTNSLSGSRPEQCHIIHKVCSIRFFRNITLNLDYICLRKKIQRDNFLTLLHLLLKIV